MSSSVTNRPLKLRLLLFLYSNANIAGCLLGMIGPLLLFLKLIGPGWQWITAGFYGIGWLVGWMVFPTPHITRGIEDSLTLEETLHRLDDLVKQAQPQLTAEMNQHLASVRTSVSEVLPRLVEAGRATGDLFTVRETVLRYLPETLANFIALPTVFRNTHPLKDGKTARQLLSDQLSLLDSKMREVVTNVASADAQALLANGQFLEMKFNQPDFLVK
jgi:hypothetical protein